MLRLLTSLTALLSVASAQPYFTSEEWKEATKGFGKHYEDHLKQELRGGRLLQALFPNIPPSRGCGELIGTVSRQEVLDLLGGLVSVLLPAGSPLGGFASLASGILTGSIKYGVQAHVLCGSCAEIEELYAGEAFLNDTSLNGWQTYCGAGKFGANVTHGALMLLPYDDVNQFPLEGKLKTMIGNHGVTAMQQNVASQYFPANVSTILEGVSSTNALVQVFNQYWTFPTVFATATGAVSIAPDALGYGQSYEHRVGFMTRAVYQQADTVLFRKAQKYVPQITNGCVELESIVSVAGYSEGGFAAFSGGLALNQMGVQVVAAQLASPLIDLPYNIGWGLEKIRIQNASDNLQLTSAFLGYGFSSTNPDLPNTGIGQDFANDAWLNPANSSRNMRVWLDGSPSISDLFGLLPLPDTSVMVNTAFLAESENDTAAGVAQCSNPTPGVTDKLCEAFEASNLRQEAINTPFPISICHSPDDDVVSIGASPDTSLSPNLINFTLAGLYATGNHIESGLFCLFSFLAPYTSLSQYAAFSLDLNSVVTLDGQCVIPTPTGTPTTAAPSASAMPSKAPVVTAAPSQSPSTAPVTAQPTPTSATSASSILVALLTVALSAVLL